MQNSNAEYEALQHAIKAEKRYRHYQYFLTSVIFIIIVIGALGIKNSINNKIDSYVRGSITRGEQRQETNKTIARESIRYNTCIFVIPVNQRTADVQERCFKAADLPGGLERSDFSPVVIPVVSAQASIGGVQDQSFAGGSDVSGGVASSPQPTTASSPAQSNNLQPTTTPEPTRVLGIPLCLPLTSVCIR